MKSQTYRNFFKYYRSRFQLFDENYYLKFYPDVAAAGVDPYRHFMSSGWREGRNPSREFNTLYYMCRNQSVTDSPANPLLHYLKSPERRRLATAPASEDDHLQAQRSVIAAHFDEYFYRRKYPEIGLDVDALGHYTDIGWREGKDPSAEFSSTAYLQANAHVAVLDVNPLYHRLLTRAALDELAQRNAAKGVQQSGNADRGHVLETLRADFDAKYYLSNHPDVANAGADPLWHYANYGWREGRNPTALFWTDYYLNHNTDVRAQSINPYYHYLIEGRSEGRRPNPIGTDLWASPEAPTDTQWRQIRPAKASPQARVSVIIPVYKGYSDTLAAIHAVLANPQRTAFNLVVINDASPDALLTAKLRSLHAEGLFQYIENEKNLGFVGTINKALEDQVGLDVILLNADTVVHGDWIDRLIVHADRDPRIATITPFSNNATICSYPLTDRNNLLKLEVSLATLDEYAAQCNQGLATPVPTGVGFCFYMRRTALQQLGPLDQEAFSRGYGEENDYCMRASKAGFLNVFAHDVFVYHTGQVSFAGFVAEEYGPGQTALLRKHPDYRMKVQRYVEADPSREARIRLDAYRMAQHVGPGAAVFVTHPWAGGIKTHTRDLAARLAQENVPVIYIYAGEEGGGRDLRIEAAEDLGIYTPNLTKINISKYAGFLLEFLGWLKPRLVHVHSLAGLDWQATDELMALLQRCDVPYAYTAHDFTSFCHRNHLIDSQGEYCAQPPIERCRRCIRTDSEYRNVVDPGERRRIYAPFLETARQVIAPSDDAASRLNRVFPRVNPTVLEHEEPTLGNHLVNPPDSFAPPLRIAIVGAIGPHKGAGVIHDLALDAKQRALPIEFTIIGYSSLAKALRELGVRETGAYRSDQDAMRLLRESDPHLALFPSIWPETYCYTLSIALAMGFPSVVFDLGAQAERVRALGAGGVLDLALADNPIALNDALLALPVEEMWTARRQPSFAVYRKIIGDYYRNVDGHFDN